MSVFEGARDIRIILRKTIALVKNFLKRADWVIKAPIETQQPAEALDSLMQNSPVDVTMGPYETYKDGLFGYKVGLPVLFARMLKLAVAQTTIIVECDQ